MDRLGSVEELLSQPHSSPPHIRTICYRIQATDAFVDNPCRLKHVTTVLYHEFRQQSQLDKCLVPRQHLKSHFRSTSALARRGSGSPQETRIRFVKFNSVRRWKEKTTQASNLATYCQSLIVMYMQPKSTLCMAEISSIFHLLRQFLVPTYAWVLTQQDE